MSVLGESWTLPSTNAYVWQRKKRKRNVSHVDTYVCTKSFFFWVGGEENPLSCLNPGACALCLGRAGVSKWWDRNSSVWFV